MKYLNRLISICNRMKELSLDTGSFFARLGANFVAVLRLLLAHPILSGLGSLAGIVGLYFALQPVASERPRGGLIEEPVLQCGRIETAYTISSSENADFHDVLKKFDNDRVKTVSGCDGHPHEAAVKRLKEHYVNTRTEFINSYSVEIKETGVPMRNDSSSQLTHTFRARCPDGMEILSGSPSLSFAHPPSGNCEFSYDSPEGVAEATVSQTNEQYSAGVLFCTYKAQCSFSENMARILIDEQSSEIQNR